VWVGANATVKTGTETNRTVGTNVHQKSTKGYAVTYTESPGASGAQPITSPDVRQATHAGAHS
jgi:hypothetical protein